MTDELISLTVDIVSAHVSHNNVTASDLPGLIASVHAALGKAANPVELEPVKAEPAVAIRSSVKQDYIVCLEDGKKLKMLKRYLRTNYDMTPDEYRAKWGLSRDYPMVAPAYVEQRRSLAHSIGLGRKAGETSKITQKTKAPAKPRKHLAKAKTKTTSKAPIEATTE